MFNSLASVGEVNHEHRYDDKYDVTGINLFFAGCKNKGLCWDQIVGAYTGKEFEVQFFNARAASGTYLITVAGVTFTGFSRKGLSL